MTTTEPTTAGEVGKARSLREHARLVTGKTNWTDSIRGLGLLHMALLRSPMAHARIDHIEVTPVLESRASSPHSAGAVWQVSSVRCPVPGRSPRR